MGRTQKFLCPSAIWSLAGIQIPPLQSLMGKVWVVLIVAQARLMRWAESAAPALPSGAGAARDTDDRKPAGQERAGSREPQPVEAFA